MPFALPDRNQTPRLPVLYEDNHLLVVSKPAPLPTMGVRPDQASAISIAKEYLRRKYHKPGNVYLGVVSRLDAMVTGVLPLAKTSKCASRLSAQFRERSPAKTYLAITPRSQALEPGKLSDWVVKDEVHHRMKTTTLQTSGAQRAELELVEIHEIGELFLLEIRLLTGRKHQIRVQLASRGAAIIGDRKYGSRQPFPGGIGLHAKKLEIEHPTTKRKLEFTAPNPPTWATYLK
ncbi:MAG: RluA family pseudouridine synthase [Pirellulaceae bacterium]